MTTDPAAVFDALEAAAGPVATRRLLTDRRGVQVWHAAGPNGLNLAVKIHAPDPDDPFAPFLPAHEITVMQALRARYGGGWRPLRHGPGWTATPWYDGPSTWRRWRDVRRGSTDPADLQAALACAVELCRAVARLHTAGWIHADIQPGHCVHTPHGPRLIDLCTAQRTDHHPPRGNDLPYTGALVHLEAPELAKALTDHKPAHPTPSSDVYALAGSLWASATGEWPLTYDVVGVDPDEDPTPVLRRAIATGQIPLRLYPPLRPGLRAALEPALAPDPVQRPTAQVLADVLAGLSLS